MGSIRSVGLAPKLFWGHIDQPDEQCQRQHRQQLLVAASQPERTNSAERAGQLVQGELLRPAVQRQRRSPWECFGPSPSITPSKVDYSDWGTGSTSGSAPGSTGKGAPGAPAHQDPFRAGGPDAVRRNLQNQMWPKEWGNDA